MQEKNKAEIIRLNAENIYMQQLLNELDPQPQSDTPQDSAIKDQDENKKETDLQDKNTDLEKRTKRISRK